MSRKSNFLKRFYAILMAFMLVFQSVAPSIALAQEASSTATTQESTASDITTDVTPDPTTEPQSSETPVVSPTPSPDSDSIGAEVLSTQIQTEQPTATSEASIVPTSSPEPSNTPAFENQNIDNLTEVSTNQSNAPPAEDLNASLSPSTSDQPQPTTEPINNTTSGHLSAVILENTDSNSVQLDLGTQDVTSASLSTDKADYAPTDTAVIAGSDFPKSADLKLIITSNNYRFEVAVKTNENGSFIYSYQLDGTYRPLYNVEVQDLNGQVLATTTFTDSPASGCSIDSAGANDLPGQKDLTKMCADYTGLPTSIGVSWQWDDAKFSGGNTGDACALFDTNSNGNANYAVCVQVGGNPGAYITKYVYSCDDSSATNCLGSVALSASAGTTCSASVGATADPFPAVGSDKPKDTVANCTVQLSDVGGSLATLTDVCSYPSASTPSNASDCIQFKVNAGKLTLTKVVNPSSDTGLFNLQIDGVTANGGANLGNGGTTLTEVVNEGSHTIGETAGLNTDLSNYTPTVECRDAHGSGAVVTTTGTNPWSLNVVDGSDILCTITNSVNDGTLIVKKVVVNDNGGTATADDFSFSVNGATPSAFESDGQNDLVVDPGTYSITEIAASGYTTTYNNCSNVTVPAGGTATCTITNNDQSGTISGMKYSDDNANGVKDSGEQGLSGWTINISGSNGFNSSAITDSNGNYSFTNLSVSTYTITEESQDGWIQKTTNPTPINLVNGQVVTGVDFGNAPVACYPDFTQVFEITGAGKTKFSYDQLKSGAWKFYAVYKVNNGSEQSVQLPVVVDGGLSAITLRGLVNIPIPNDLNWNVTLDWRFEVREGATVLFNSGYLGERILNPQEVGIDCQVENTAFSPVSATSVFKLHDADGDGSVDPLFDDGLSGWDINVTDAGNNTVTQTTVGDGLFGGGTTFNLDLGTYTITETQKSGWTESFPNSSSTSLDVIDCPNPNICTPTSDGKWLVIINDPSKSISLAFGNYETPKLTVNKVVVNDNGGTKVIADFPLFVNATQVTSGATNTFAPGSYTISETGDPGYIATFSGDCDGSGHITLAAGENKICTIANDDKAPILTLIKSVVNDNGGNALSTDWMLEASGPTSISGLGSAVSGATFSAGVYTLSETGPSNYFASNWNCTGGLLAGNQLTIGLGEQVSCEITNDDETAYFSLFKIVNNNHGGNADADDFGLTVNGNSVFSSEFLEVNSNTPITINEAGLPGYSFVEITGDPGCPTTLGGTVTLNEGEYMECYITNEDISASITLVKVVNNLTGGNAVPDDFSLTIDGVNVLSGSTTSVNSNTPHTINEANLSGYNFISISGDAKCPSVLGGTVTLNEGEHISCFITNQDVAPTLTLIKNVINDNGGNAVPDDFSLTIDGLSVLSGSPTAVLANTTITFDEAQVLGYSFVSITGDAKCPSVLGGGLILNEGENITCIITNNDIAPSITLIKNVINDNGGNAGVNDFGLSVGGTLVNSGDTLSVLANIPVEINEAGLSGYDFVSITGDSKCPSVLGGTITLNEGEHITCTITNDDQSAIVSLFKIVNNNHGGTAKVDDFGLSVNGTVIPSSGFVEVNSNTPVTINEAGLPGYNFVSITGDPRCPAVLGGTVILDEGDYLECYITNEDQVGTLIVKKIVVNDNGGTKKPEDFAFSVNGATPSAFESDGQNDLTVDAGVYSVTEASASGYVTTYDNCENVSVANGETQTCTITNDDAPATLTVNKILKGPFFLAKDPGSFDILVDNNVKQTGITDQQVRTNSNDPISNDVDGTTGSITLNAGVHTISEVGTLNSNTDAEKYSKDISCVDANSNPVTALAIGVLDQFNNPTPNPWQITVANGQNVTCTVTNIYPSIAQAGNQIVLLKHTLGGDDTFSFSGTQAVPGTLFDTPVPFSVNVTTVGGTNGFDLGGVETSFDTIAVTSFPGFPATVTLTEDSLPAGWSFDNLSCIAKDGLSNPGLSTINIGSKTADITFVFDEEVTCTYTNTKLPTLTVNKILSPSTDSGKFNLAIDGVNFATDVSDGGTTGVQQVSVGAHTVSESAGTGTTLGTYTSVIGGDCATDGTVTLAAGENKVCTVTNTLLPPVLTLSKSNNASSEANPGAQVLYTLTLSLSGSGLTNVSLVDLLPNGFKYKGGSWTAVSNLRGNLKDLGITTEPTYASPGTWTLGNMVGGETVTLTLLADISSSIDHGLYKDLAWAKGTSSGGTVMANDASGLFVGTSVYVAVGSGGSHYDVLRTEQKIGDVLGASIEMPQTGANDIWIKIALGLFMIGSILAVTGIVIRRKI